MPPRTLASLRRWPHWRLAALLTVLAAVTAFAWRVRAAEPPRVAKARAEREGDVKALCRAAGVKYPPREIFLRGLKHEGLLECWGRSDGGPLRFLKAFPVTQGSGGPGPKRREGDGQVPEGCYIVDRFNPESLFHLSLGLNYPNESDRLLGDPQTPGFDIFLHGGAASVGCVPIGDGPVEELYLLALAGARDGRTIHVHLFPARMAGPQWEAYRAEHTATRPELTAFWADLQKIYVAFESTHLVPAVKITAEGRYVLE